EIQARRNATETPEPASLLRRKSPVKLPRCSRDDLPGRARRSARRRDFPKSIRLPPRQRERMPQFVSRVDRAIFGALLLRARKRSRPIPAPFDGAKLRGEFHRNGIAIR